MKKLKINLASSLPDRAATVSIWINDVQVENVITVETTWTKEYDLTGTNPHNLRIKMENDYTSGSTDLNLLIKSIQLSDDAGVYPTYDYIVPDANMNLRDTDLTNDLLLTTLWGTPNEFTMTIDENNTILWHDYYQENLDNPT